MSSSNSTRFKLLALLGALLGIVSVGLGVQAAFSKPALAPPTITSKPAAATTSTGATFAFTGPSGSTFKCRLDAEPSYSTCTSPKNYPGLSEGSHTFSVIALKGSDQSSPTTYTWIVDNTAPAAPTITDKPGDPSNSTAPSFSFTGAEPGLTFQCKLDTGSYSACPSPAKYSKLSPGSHTFEVRAVDAAGNAGVATSYTWMLDTTPPQPPVLTLKPDNPTYNATNFFVWTGPSESGLTYQCSEENGAWRACVAPHKMVIDTTNYGLHQFAVRSVDSAGNVSTATAYTFKYEKKLPDSGVPFTITGQVDPLVIGVWQPIRLTISNPNSVKIYVSSLLVSVPASGDSTACPSGENLEFEDSNVSPTNLLEVPAAINGNPGTLTLSTSSGQYSPPRMRLKNLPVNQDPCKSVTFGLSFSGTATN